MHRLLATLTYRGYARQNSRSRKYTLGVKTLILASSARERLGPFSRPFLRELMEASGESSNLATLDKTSVIYLEQVSSPRMVRMFTEPGNRVSPHSSGTGKVLLAYQPSHVMDSILRHTELPRCTRYTITEPETLKEELKYLLQSLWPPQSARCIVTSS